MESINISEVIVSSSDWSVETILDQFSRENIQINPSSRRRHAWDLVVKSRFIESIILGFPIPQILLAADLKERGKHAVVDGNQRLLSILEFYGETETENNGFVLTGLEFIAILFDLLLNQYVCSYFKLLMNNDRSIVNLY